ncbi:MAG: hypothetical protein JNM84_12955 [Planctomycetes bacterium]|nr:hypothetical protein [Planctomycetota bacterium]
MSASSHGHKVAGFLLVDANVLIDFAEAEISVLSIASVALAPVYVVREVLREVPRLDAAACKRLGIHVLEPEVDELAAAAARRGSLSFEDHLCLLVAEARGWTCVTNDGALRRACAVEGVAVLWGLELMAQLVEAGHFDAARAGDVAEAIHRSNPLHITVAILARFRERLGLPGS